MTPLSFEILSNWQTRNTKKQKQAFRAFLKERLPGLTEEKAGSFGGVNLVLGDLDNAQVVFSAHYDTCTVLPFPNYLTPKNIPLYVLYNLAIAGAMCGLASGASRLGAFLFQSFWAAYFSGLAMCFLCLLIMLGGRPNPHTANDNTSGVVSLCEIYSALTEEQRKKAAFVFFDNEELGLLGSRGFLKKNKPAMKEKLLVNLDCVSDGDYLMLIVNKAARQNWQTALSKAFGGETLPQGKECLVEKSSSTLYPSDQLGFPYYAAIAAFRKGRFGFFLSRIHTKKDTVFQEENIKWLRDSAKLLLEHLHG